MLNLQKLFDQNSKYIFFFCISVAGILGLFHGLLALHDMNPDGISYMDVADAYRRGDISKAINGWWGPLYSWLIAFLFSLFSPGVFFEFQSVHFLNIGIYIATLVSFTFFVHQFLHKTRGFARVFNDTAFVFLAYALFIVSSIHMITLSIVTPDMLVALYVYTISAYGLSLVGREKTSKDFFLFGLLMGLGYLAKAPLLPGGFLFIFALLFLEFEGWKRVATCLGVACLGFALIGGPFIGLLSLEKNRFTFGDSGKVNYAWYVNKEQKHLHWHGEDAKHPTRVIQESPKIYSFGNVFPQSTYAPWYDPSYWHEGIEVSFSLREQWLGFLENVKEYMRIGAHYFPFLTLLCIVLLFAFKDVYFKRVSAYAFLFLPNLGVLGMYSLVLVKERYVAPFIVMACLGIFGAFSVIQENSSSANRARLRVTAASLICFLLVACMSILQVGERIRTSSDMLVHWEVARALHEEGIQEGDQIGYVGNVFSGLGAFWARLARVYIITEMPSSPDNNLFWKGSPAFQQNSIEAFRKTGVRAIVAEPAEMYYQSMQGWKELRNTRYFIYKF